MKFGKKNLLIVGLFILLLLLVCGWWNNKVQLADYKNQISQFTLNEQSFEEQIGKSGETIVSQKQLILSQKDAIELNLLEIDRLKNVKAQITYKTKIVIDSVFVPFADTLLVRDTIYPKGVISVPKRFKLSDKHYSFDGLINIDGVLLDSLKIMNELKIVIGSKSNGIFKASTPVVEIENTNPYIQTTGLNNVIIENKKKWHEKKITWFGIGFGVGVTTLVLLIK